MGKKKVEEMDAQREVFIQGATQNGLEKQQASNLFDLLKSLLDMALTNPMQLLMQK